MPIRRTAPRARAAFFRAVFPCVLGLAGCNAITGVDDYHFGTGSGGAGPGTSVGGSGGSHGTTNAGGAGGGETACEATQKECSEMCVSKNDPAFGCGIADCTACDANSLCCANSQILTCTDVSVDPKRCGSCSNECSQAEWCESSMCKCRPGLTGSQGNCVDPLANPGSCGGGAACMGATPACEDGTCVAACSSGRTNCSDGCFDTDASPLHCGSCAKKCSTDELCVGGECLGYQVAVGCSACPCTACSGDFDKCCGYPGTAVAICVNHDAPGCP